jgi:hypothetical protein
VGCSAGARERRTSAASRYCAILSRGWIELPTAKLALPGAGSIISLPISPGRPSKTGLSRLRPAPLSGAGSPGPLYGWIWFDMLLQRGPGKQLLERLPACPPQRPQKCSARNRLGHAAQPRPAQACYLLPPRCAPRLPSARPGAGELRRAGPGRGAWPCACWRAPSPSFSCLIAGLRAQPSRAVFSAAFSFSRVSLAPCCFEFLPLFDFISQLPLLDSLRLQLGLYTSPSPARACCRFFPPCSRPRFRRART